MKTKNRQLLALSAALALALSIGVTSCKKDSDNNSKAMSATVGNSSFEPGVVAANAQYNGIYVTGLRVTTSDSAMLMFTIPDTCKVNSKYDFYIGGIYFDDYTKQKSYGNLSSYAHGSFTLSTFDKTNKKVSGNFSGVLYTWSGYDSVVVKDGQFNTTYK